MITSIPNNFFLEICSFRSAQLNMETNTYPIDSITGDQDNGTYFKASTFANVAVKNNPYEKSTRKFMYSRSLLENCCEDDFLSKIWEKEESATPASITPAYNTVLFIGTHHNINSDKYNQCSNDHIPGNRLVKQQASPNHSPNDQHRFVCKCRGQ